MVKGLATGLTLLRIVVHAAAIGVTAVVAIQSDTLGTRATFVALVALLSVGFGTSIERAVA